MAESLRALMNQCGHGQVTPWSSEMPLEHLGAREIQTITRRSCLGFQQDVVISEWKWISAAASWVGCVWGICLKPSCHPVIVVGLASLQQAQGDQGTLGCVGAVPGHGQCLCRGC